MAAQGSDINRQGSDGGSSPLRAFLLAMPLLLLIAAVALLVVSPFAWGAGDVLDLPAWLPPLIGISLALIGIAISVYAVQETSKRTRGAFSVFALQLVFGIVMFLAGALFLAAMATQIPSEATYERALDPAGEPEVSPVFFTFGTIVIGAMALGWVWMAAYVYVNAITNNQPNRISERRPGEVDGIGELLKRRQ